MTTDTFIRELETYLEDYRGATPLPEFIREAVRVQVPGIRQDRLPARTRLGRAFRSLPPVGRFAAVAAVVLLATLVGWSLISRVNIATKPTPSPRPVATPQALGPGTGAGTLAPGTYRVGDPFQVPFSLTLPDGWHVNFTEPGRAQLLKRHSLPGAAYIPFTERGQGPSVHDAGTVGVFVVNGVYADPCHAAAGGLIEPAPISTVDELTEALTHQAGIRATRPRPVTVGGAVGVTFQLQAKQSAFRAECDHVDGLFQWSHAGIDPSTGEPAEIADGTHLIGLIVEGFETEQQEITVLDVHGTVVLIETVTLDETRPVEQQEIRDVVASIRFE